jgi:hypothetical protein
MEWLGDWWWLTLLPAVLYGLHRVACVLEDRGLIHYRHPSTRGTAIALMNYQRLFEPAVEHVIEYQRSGDLTIQTSSEPVPEPATDASPLVAHNGRPPDLTVRP